MYIFQTANIFVQKPTCFICHFLSIKLILIHILKKDDVQANLNRNI